MCLLLGKVLASVPSGCCQTTEPVPWRSWFQWQWWNNWRDGTIWLRGCQRESMHDRRKIAVARCCHRRLLSCRIKEKQHTIMPAVISSRSGSNSEEGQVPQAMQIWCHLKNNFMSKTDLFGDYKSAMGSVLKDVGLPLWDSFWILLLSYWLWRSSSW